MKFEVQGASVSLGTTARVALEAGPLRLSVGVTVAQAAALVGGGEPFEVVPAADEDPVYLEGEGVLGLTSLRLTPSGGGAFAVEAGGSLGWGPSARPWTLGGTGRVGLVEAEHRSEKGARQRLAEVLPAPSTEEWTVEAYEVPEIGLWRVEAERR